MQPTQDTNRQLACMYTKHKTQKKKVWHDGRLAVHHQSRQVSLYDSNPIPGSGDPVLDESEIPCAEWQKLLQLQEFPVDIQLESEKFLIQIEGPWVASPLEKTENTNERPISRKTSRSMQKLFTRKYKKPRPFRPTQNRKPQRWQQALVKRRRPLQPGELEKSYSATGYHSSSLCHTVQVNTGDHGPSHCHAEFALSTSSSNNHQPRACEASASQATVGASSIKTNRASVQRNTQQSSPPRAHHKGGSFASNDFISNDYYGIEEATEHSFEDNKLQQDISTNEYRREESPGDAEHNLPALYSPTTLDEHSEVTSGGSVSRIPGGSPPFTSQRSSELMDLFCVNNNQSQKRMISGHFPQKL